MLARADRPAPGFWASCSWQAWLSKHALTCGSSGSGKSFLGFSTLMQAAVAGIPVVVVDNKGELCDLLLQVGLPALAANDPTIPQRVRVIDPFGSGGYLPHLRLTAPERGIDPEVQAGNLADMLEDSLDDTMGVRGLQVFLQHAALAVELNEPLIKIKAWLDNPAAFARAALQSKNEVLRVYAATITENESKLTIDSIRAKLNRFFFLPDTRRILTAPSCVSFHDSFLPGAITLVQLGKPPTGAERLQKFFQAVLFRMLSNACIDRDAIPSDNKPHVLCVLEEFQAGMSSRSADHFSRLLSLSRYRKISLSFSNQQISQVSAVDPNLLRLLRTNTGYEMLFRSNLEDAKLLAPALAGIDNDLRRAITARMIRLKRREFFLWIKEGGCSPLVRSPLLDMDALRARAESLPRDVYDAIQQGTVALPRAAFHEPMPPRPYLAEE